MVNVFSRMAEPVMNLPRPAKRAVAVGLDASLCVLTVWLAFYLRLGYFVPFSARLWLPAVASLLMALPLFIISGLYRAIFRYSGLHAMLALVRAMLLYGVLFAAVFTVYGVDGVPRTVGIIQPLLLLILVGSSRALARIWLGGLYHQKLRRSALPKALIYGAGKAGRQLAAGLLHSHDMRVVGFLDDDDRLHGQVLNGLSIYSPEDLEDLLVDLSVTDILLALPTVTRQRRNEILNQLAPFKVLVRTLPSMGDLVQGRVSVSDVRELDLDDLLGREPVRPNQILLSKAILNKTVLVTGAGGSIGSELCRQIMAVGPKRLLLVEQSEFALYAIHQELEALNERWAEEGKALGAAVELLPLLASVQDGERLHEIMATWRPDTVYHAAAYKHVPLVEHNPVEGVKNNVWGTRTVAQAALENKVANFVLISTDKAVRPTNIMGASKRLAEMVLQAMASQGGETTFSMVRFGNVLGSSGSVVPKFRQQIHAGGPITLTHADITRYFMTIPEAAQLVIQAGAMGRGGDVFVLDMGEPVRIMDLARRMVELSGMSLQDEGNPEGDITIEVSGLRPGEKLYEELLIGDNPEPTTHPRIMRAREGFLSQEALNQKLNALGLALDASDVGSVRRLLQELVTGYQPSDGIVDWVYLEQAHRAL